MPTKAELLERLTAQQLRKIAADEGIPIEGGMTKGQLVELLARKLRKDVILAYVAEYTGEKLAALPTPTKRRRRRKRRGAAAQVKGMEFEKRVARWLAKEFGADCELRVLARGKTSKKPYEVDILANCPAVERRALGLIKRETIKQVWVECKAQRVNREHIAKLLMATADVAEAYDEGIEEEIYPDIVMVVGTGFDSDAVALANEKNIYCVEAGSRGFRFVGRLTKEDFTGELGWE